MNSCQGKCDLLDQAMVSFATASADRNERDYEQSQDAVATCRVSSHMGL